MARLVERALKVAQPLPDEATRFGKAVRAQDQQRDDEEEKELGAAHTATG